MQQTTNYNLNKPELTDSPPDITVLNPNWDTIDTMLKEIGDGYLPLSGGTMTGTILYDPTLNTFATIGYDYTSKHGSLIAFRSKNYADNSGGFDLFARNDDAVCALTGYANGTLTWNNNNVITSVGGTFDGNLVFSQNEVEFSRPDGSGLFVIRGGASGITGATLALYGKDYSGFNGLFAIEANDGTNSKTLNGNPNGSLTWDGKKVITEDETATASTFGLLTVADETDEVDCQCEDAAITPKALYNLSDYRQVSTAYVVGDKVNVPYQAGLIMECTTEGTTSEEALDTSDVTAGQIITDGTVVWLVKNAGISEIEVIEITSRAGDLKASLATNIDGWLLCDGARLSRITYSTLFNVIGINFGAGGAVYAWKLNDVTYYTTSETLVVGDFVYSDIDCTEADTITSVDDTTGTITGALGTFTRDTTSDVLDYFNLPDFRDRTLWGANGNLMEVLEAGLPDHTHTFSRPNSTQGHGSNTPLVFTASLINGTTGKASASNSIYGASTTVQPPAIAVNIFIKY